MQKQPRATVTRKAARYGAGEPVKIRRPGTGAGDAPRPPSPAPQSTGRRGANWTSKPGTQARSVRPYPVKACSTRWKDPATGQFVPTPTDTGAGKLRKGRTGAAITIRNVTEYHDGTREVTGVKTVLGAFRRGQERGKVSKRTVRDAERETSREVLAELNPRLAASLDSEAMHEAHRSDKARRGAATRTKNKAAGIGKKKRAPELVQADVLKTEAALKDAQRRHRVAKTPAARDRYGAQVRARSTRLAKLRRELAQVSR